MIGTRRLRVVVSDRSDGDFHPQRVPLDVLDARQRALCGRRFSMVDEVHGTDVSERCSPWPLVATADVLVAAGDTDPPVGVWAGDCASVILFGANGTVVGCHAGWRGLAAGVIDVAVDALEERSEAVIAAVAGPMIHPECYAFGASDLAAVAAAVGVEPHRVTSVTADGDPALDVPAAVTAALARRGVDADVVGDCTACAGRWYSHRARQDAERHVLVGWSEPAPARVGR